MTSKQRRIFRMPPSACRLTDVSLTHTAPEVPPSEVSGGGGSRSELVITWDVSVWPLTCVGSLCTSSLFPAFGRFYFKFPLAAFYRRKQEGLH